MKQYSHPVHSFNWRAAIAVTLAFLLMSICNGAAFAHAKLVKSDPPNRATLNVAPEHIQLWFNEEIEGNFASISLIDADGNTVTDASPETVPDDLKSVVLPLSEIPPGRYTVNFRIMSTDGHVVESDYNFTLKNTE
ncbi:MAG: copper resistance protein [Nitrosomonas sp.]|jgi:copper resistance protein C|nr:MAG: copper resistance protein [Nitrosomonas sp.]